MIRKILIAITLGFSFFCFWKALARTSIGSISNYTPGNCTDPNVAAYFDMDQGGGNLVVPTRCAAGGTVLTKNGTPTYSVSAPNGLGNAITFNGSDACFSTAGDVDTLDVGTSTAVWEGWVKTTTNSGFIAEKSNATGWKVSIANHSARLTIADGVNSCVTTATSAVIDDGVYHYIRLTWNGSNTCTVQQDGGTVVSVIQAVGNVNNARVAAVGGNECLNNYFNGTIADLRITIGNSTNNLGATAVATSRGAASSRSAASNRVSIGSVSNYTPGNCTDANVQAYLSMDEASGNLVVPTRCSSGGKILTKNGSPTYSASAPTGLLNAITLGPAAYFKGSAANSTDGMDIQTQDAVEEMWAKITTPVSGTAFLVVKGGYATNRPGHEMFVFNNKPGAAFVDQAAHQCAVSDITVPGMPTVDNTNYHLFRSTWVNSTGTCSLYYDGVLVGSQTVAAMIGGNLTSIRFFWLGAEDGDSDTQTISIAEYRLTVGNATNAMSFTAIPTSRTAAQ